MSHKDWHSQKMAESRSYRFWFRVEYIRLTLLVWWQKLWSRGA